MKEVKPVNCNGLTSKFKMLYHPRLCATAAGDLALAPVLPHAQAVPGATVLVPERTPRRVVPRGAPVAGVGDPAPRIGTDPDLVGDALPEDEARLCLRRRCRQHDYGSHQKECCEKTDEPAHDCCSRPLRFCAMIRNTELGLIRLSLRAAGQHDAVSSKR
ncbi:MAG TPA: hypothetical protein V6C86_25490 [Oculatellaceae cyanobacterium]